MVHTLRTVDDLRAFYRRELAPERSATNTWLPDANNDGSRDWRDLAQMKERLYRIEDTNGDGIADRSQIMIEGFSADPASDVAGGVLYHGGDLFLGASPALWRLRDSDGDGFIDSQVAVSEGYNVHPAFGGHGISGVTLGPDGRIYWEVGDMGLDVVDRVRPPLVVSESGRRSPRQPRRVGLRGLCHRHPQSPGVRLRRLRQSDQRGQRRRPSGRDRADRVSAGRLRQRLARELAVRQVHRSRQQWLQRLDGRGDVQASFRRPARAHHAAHRCGLPRSGRDGARPRHGPFGRMAESLLRLQLPGHAGQLRDPCLSTEVGRRRLRAGRRTRVAAGHPDRRPQVRSRWRVVSRRLDHRLGREGGWTHLEGRRAVFRGKRNPEGSAVAAVAELRRAAVPPISACCSSMPTSACV